MILQAALQDSGFRLPHYGVDGLFGEETESAVIRAQRRFSMEPTGIAGQALFTALGMEAITSPARQSAATSSHAVRRWILAGILVGALIFTAQKIRK